MSVCEVVRVFYMRISNVLFWFFFLFVFAKGPPDGFYGGVGKKKFKAAAT